ncbi:MAG: hypothetical protein M1421_03230 [Candidatus Eremiobacteraeota bacterium]|nr:hypothetical protein [Candidatus Eremiobacteraeota bacterium]
MSNTNLMKQDFDGNSKQEAILSIPRDRIEHSRFTSGIYVPAERSSSVYDFLKDERSFSAGEGIYIPVVFSSSQSHFHY